MSTYPENPPEDSPGDDPPITCPICDKDAYEECECDLPLTDADFEIDPDLNPNREEPS